ncbi:MAG: hypothetical protein ACKVX7_12415 [Planctomycetota bacterium]
MAATAFAFDENKPKEAGKKAIGDPYMLDTCPVSGKKLEAKPTVYQHEGREVRFCCDKCIDGFKAEPAKFIAKIDQDVVKQQAPMYPLKTCLVSDEALGADTVDWVFNNRLVRLCCKKCSAEVQKDPAKFLKKLDDAVIAAQKEKYPIETCVVSGEKLGGMGEPVNMVIGNRLVRLCCGACKKAVMADPLTHLAKLSGDGKGKKPTTEKPAGHP